MAYSTRNNISEQQHNNANSQTATAQFADNRTSAATQLKQQTLMAASPTATAQRAAVNTMNISAVQQQKIIQRAVPEEELQMKAIHSTTQLAGMDEEELLQGKFETAQRAEDEELLQGKFEPAQRAEKPNNTGLPDNLKSGIENLSGMSMDHVKVHYNSDKPAQLQAHAYAQGSDIHVAPGQEQHLPHEAWHVVQQAQGRVRPTVQMKGNVQVNDDVGLEAEADVMGGRALQRHTQTESQKKNKSWLISNDVTRKKVQAPMQLAKLTSKDASDQANNARTANKYNRAAMTNDWISVADEVATIAQWSALTPYGYIYNSSPSISNGGLNRPTSIDLKAKPIGTAEAEFIFHLPKFTNILDLISYLMRSSGIQAKIAEITAISAINLITPSDFELDKIENAQKVDIAALTNHPIYIANSAEILANNPMFLTDLQANRIDVSNAALDGVRNDPNYKLGLEGKKAKIARQKHASLLKFLSPHLLQKRSESNFEDFERIKILMNDLNQHYAIAIALFSPSENLQHLTLRAAFENYTQVRNDYENLERQLNVVFQNIERQYTYTDESWNKAVEEYTHLGDQYKSLKLHLTSVEGKTVLELLANSRRELVRKKPSITSTYQQQFVSGGVMDPKEER